MKANKLLVLLPAFLLMGCSLGGEASKEFDKGVITSAEDKENFSNIYTQSDANLAKAESTTSSTQKAKARFEDSDLPTVDGETPESAVTEEEPAETLEINSFHADYKLDFEFAVSLNDQEITHQIDKQNYTVDFEKTESGFLLDASLSHEYQENLIHAGSESIDLNYQDGTLFAKQTVTNNWLGSIQANLSYNIDLERAYSEFSDYFVSMASNVKLHHNSELSVKDVIDQLLDSGKVAVTSTKGNIVTADITLDEGVATVSMDVVDKVFTSVKFNKSEMLDDSVLSKLTSLLNYKVTKSVFSVEMNFSYNKTKVTKLTEEEVGQYINCGLDFSHYSDYGSEKGDKGDTDRSYHGGHIEINF